jgi:hypothetical protein
VGHITLVVVFLKSMVMKKGIDELSEIIAKGETWNGDIIHCFTKTGI